MSRKRKTSRRSSRITFVVGAILLAISAGLIYTVVIEVMDTFRLKAEVKQAEQLLQQVQSENEILEEQKVKLNDPEYVKSYARGEYLLSKEGEQIFKLPPKEAE